MGSVWLGSLPQVLRDAGLVVNTWPGWETRSRSSGGYNDVRAIGIHHDAIRTGTPLASRCSAAWERDVNRPVGACWLHTDGQWMVGAAGATNTQGKGGPHSTSKGTIPLDQGNLYMLSVEASNNGVGEVWPEVMQQSYVRGCAALCKWLALNPATDVIAHFEWTTRKIDPSGPSKWAWAGEWNMDAYRADVRAGLTQPSEEDDAVRIGTIRQAGQVAEFDQYDNGTKVWIPDEETAAVMLFLDPSRRVVDLPDAAWMKAAGPVVGPIPPGCDAWGSRL